MDIKLALTPVFNSLIFLKALELQKTNLDNLWNEYLDKMKVSGNATNSKEILITYGGILWTTRFLIKLHDSHLPITQTEIDNREKAKIAFAKLQFNLDNLYYPLNVYYQTLL